MCFSLALLAFVITARPSIDVPQHLNEGEKPVEITSAATEIAANGLYSFIKYDITFTNPNRRQFAAELRFPIPDGAAICGYELEIGSVMVPGVVTEKEAARVAFENEVRKNVDPGIVEHVKGNEWKTRVFPIPAQGTRKASVTIIAENRDAKEGESVSERHGGFVYTAVKSAANLLGKAEFYRSYDKGVIWWDATRLAEEKSAEKLALLTNLPEEGEWELKVYRNIIEKPRTFTKKSELIAAIKAEVFDGGIETRPEEEEKLPRTIQVVRREATSEDGAIKEGKLLATAYAKNRIEDLKGEEASHKEEILALGREFSIASPISSLIVLEKLEDYLHHKIEPHKALPFHARWVELRAKEDDEIASRKEQAEFEAQVLEYWQERIKWYNDPKPKIVTPKSGVFEELGCVASMDAESEMISGAEPEDSLRSIGASAPQAFGMAMSAPRGALGEPRRRDAPASEESAAATIKIAAWDPNTPYLKAIKSAAKDKRYETYLTERKKSGSSPAFYLDVADFFFKEGEDYLAKRILSNLIEFRLEEATLWRAMAWRLRAAKAYDEAIAAFRHILKLRGEEAQSYRDLALVLTERGKILRSKRDLEEAQSFYKRTIFENHGRRSARRGNDLQAGVMAIEELNALMSWIEAETWQKSEKPSLIELDSVFRREMPMDLRIIMSWDQDEVDIDIHVLEPNNEEAYYQNRRTREGGFVGEDVTTGYGPEEYLAKKAQMGVYKIMTNYYASHKRDLVGPTTVTATIYTNWGRKNERTGTLTLRLDSVKQKHEIGEVRITE